MPKVHIPTPLRQYAGKLPAVDVKGSTIGEALTGLVSQHPDLRRHLYTDEGKLRAWRSIHVTDHGGDHPYMDKWWVPGLQIGYEHSFVHQVADFLDNLAKGKPTQPDFRNAYHTQLVLDAILDSAKSHKWTEVPKG